MNWNSCETRVLPSLPSRCLCPVVSTKDHQRWFSAAAAAPILLLASRTSPARPRSPSAQMIWAYTVFVMFLGFKETRMIPSIHFSDWKFRKNVCWIFHGYYLWLQFIISLFLLIVSFSSSSCLRCYNGEPRPLQTTSCTHSSTPGWVLTVHTHTLTLYEMILIL